MRLRQHTPPEKPLHPTTSTFRRLNIYTDLALKHKLSPMVSNPLLYPWPVATGSITDIGPGTAHWVHGPLLLTHDHGWIQDKGYGADSTASSTTQPSQTWQGRTQEVPSINARHKHDTHTNAVTHSHACKIRHCGRNMGVCCYLHPNHTRLIANNASRGRFIESAL